MDLKHRSILKSPLQKVTLLQQVANFWVNFINKK